ncbi:MAG: heparinase II/III family protein [Clostridia bacterium]|nr:heparinase II/III family protein [Clostridia bacterium]
MKKYTVEEIAEILRRHDDSACYYTEADRQRVLNNKAIEPYLKGMREQYEDYKTRQTVALPFSKFKRFFKDGNRQDGEYWYYYNRRKLHACALAAWLYQEKEQLEELEDILWAIMDEYMWNIPAHVGGTGLTHYQPDDFYIDLFSAETCHAVAEILALVGDKIEPIITVRAHRLIEERCFAVLDKPFWWKKATHNWSAVCAGEVGMTAIYVKKDPDVLAKIIHECLGTMECYLSGFPNDGACREGLGYWGYGFGYFTYFGDLLYKRTGGEINVFDDEKVKNIAAFQKKCFFKGGKIVTFSDCGGSDSSKFNIPITMKLHEFYPDITLPERELVGLEYRKVGANSFAPILRTILWAPDSFDGRSLEVGNTYIFPDAQWYISSSTGGIGLAAKAGYNWEAFESHNHNDVGNFHIYKNGVNLISDIGAGVYSATYFNHEYRYSNFACSSEGHNLPIIDGGVQKYGERFRSSGTVITEESGITSDIAGAYDEPNLESLVRNVYLNKGEERVYLTDTYRFKEAPKSVTERFISYHEPKLEGGKVTITAGGEAITISFDESVVKPNLHVFEDVDCRVRQAPGFKVHIVDLEVINPTKEFTVKVTFE